MSANEYVNQSSNTAERGRNTQPWRRTSDMYTDQWRRGNYRTDAGVWRRVRAEMI